MSTRSDWEEAAEEFMAAERERLGGPPTPEEVVAYARGELSEDDAARVRALLVYYPGLTSVLAEPAPPVPLQPRARFLAVAASVLALCTAGLGVQVYRLTRELNEPHAVSRRVLRPVLLTRGSGRPPANVIPAAGKEYLLALDGLPERAQYRIDVMRDGEKVWTGAAVETPELTMRLRPGVYRIDVYGADETESLARYEIRVTEAGGSDRPRG